MLEHFNSLFEVDKNNIHIRNLSEIRRLIARHNNISDIYSVDINKINKWVNYSRHAEDPKESFEKEFNYPYDKLPNHFKDFNLNKEIYPHQIDLGVNQRYTDYIYSKTIKVLESILFSNFIEEEKDNYIICNKIYGDIDIMPFMKAFVHASSKIYDNMSNKTQLERNNGNLNLIKTFTAHSLSNIQDETDNKYKENNLAVMVEIYCNLNELKKQKLVS